MLLELERYDVFRNCSYLTTGAIAMSIDAISGFNLQILLLYLSLLPQDSINVQQPAAFDWFFLGEKA